MVQTKVLWASPRASFRGCFRARAEGKGTGRLPGRSQAGQGPLLPGGSVGVPATAESQQKTMQADLQCLEPSMHQMQGKGRTSHFYKKMSMIDPSTLAGECSRFTKHSARLPCFRPSEPRLCCVVVTCPPGALGSSSASAWLICILTEKATSAAKGRKTGLLPSWKCGEDDGPFRWRSETPVSGSSRSSHACSVGALKLPSTESPLCQGRPHSQRLRASTKDPESVKDALAKLLLCTQEDLKL